MKAVIDIESFSPISFLDVYEENDQWDMIQGCVVCPVEIKKKCCHDCFNSLPSGDCSIHGKGKPFNCIIAPSIKTFVEHCSLEYKSIKGSHKGKIRRVKDKLNVFQDS